ncbi:ribosome small subunit-dependent GTPase A [bacterium]|nr:ribosome small subunit-dependent GTPase A [bacterium]MBQ9149807.1 ribosome small subunit-dependent GTPase A [bacterium]
MQAQVFKIHSDFYYVKNFEGNNYTCKLRDVLKKQKIEIRVGDFVELSEDNNFISQLLDRKNFINRPKVSNIDCALVVCALKEPELDLIQLNRYLTYLKYNNIEAAICFNKEDLIDDIEKKKQEVKAIYADLGYKTFFISAKDKLDLEELSSYIKNKTIVLCGMSGVGKSTLLNAFNSDISLRTGEVSAKTQKGCHTTRHCEIIECNGFKLIDTPGFSCLKFDFLLPDKLLELFDDIKIYTNECKYSDCLHNVSDNFECGVIKNLDKINKARYESYLCFLNESLEYKESIKKRSIKEESSNKNIGNRVSVKISKRKRDASRNTEKQKIKEYK